jgi:hypothetical protein
MRGPEIDGRPQRKRGERRLFRPNYVSFSGTYECNLSCAHCCVPIHWKDKLDIAAAVKFLESAHEVGVRIVGFTGGEPFLYPEFLNAVARRAVELGWTFDKVMSNGTWYEDRAHLERVLRDLYATGYSGRIGLSVDKFHPVRTPRLKTFCEVVRKVSGRDDAISINYASEARDKGLKRAEALAAELGGTVAWSDLLRAYMLVSEDISAVLHWNHLAPVERAEHLGGGWDGTWFQEDYCEGPGQALIVTARGEIKPCCGFASDLDQLTIGSIYEHTAAEAIERGRKHPVVGKIFSKGLSALRDEILAEDPDALPGATSNHCFFCWYALTRGLAAGMPGGGGQVGDWTGLRKLPLISQPGTGDRT